MWRWLKCDYARFRKLPRMALIPAVVASFGNWLYTWLLPFLAK